MKLVNGIMNTIVPELVRAEPSGGQVSIQQLIIDCSGDFAAEAQLLAERHSLKTTTNTPKSSEGTLISWNKVADLPEEAYRIVIGPDGVQVSASSANGAFYAGITLSQWLWQHGTLPCGSVYDEPCYPWRGFMLDTARHFFPISYIQQLILQLAAYKINRLHLHLSDDQGWRLEIVAYPRLTEFGSRRYCSFDDIYAGAPSECGYYSQEEIRKLIKFAAAQHIEIIPEIDLPGHALAVLAAYPELNCKQEDLQVLPLWGISRGTLCLGNPASWHFVYKILDELCQLFPSKYIHLGGDEVPRMHWEECDKCQALISEQNLGDADGLQNEFTRKTRDYLAKQGKQAIYWDEAEESGLSEGTVIAYWRSRAKVGGKGDGSNNTWGMQAAQKGVPVISCPDNGAYFDHALQKSPHAKGNLGLCTVHDTYSFMRLRDLDPELRSELGVQANLWTEKVLSPVDCEYMIFPRLLALAEQAWHKGGWEAFCAKWPEQEKVLAALGIANYYRGPWT